MLAFKSDVSHWRKKDELTGVSIRYVFSSTDFCTSIDLVNAERYVSMLFGPGRAYESFFTVQIVTNVFVQLVILLYLIDNNTDTSWMILMGSGMGVLIEAWKVRLACSLTHRLVNCYFQIRSRRPSISRSLRQSQGRCCLGRSYSQVGPRCFDVASVAMT
jgi:hypothetical protein